jgi:hypothetical protein
MIRSIQQHLFPHLEHYDLGGGKGKVCSKCTKYLPLSSFTMHSGGNYLRPECKKCNSKLNKIRKALRNLHGMPEEGYTCPICNQNEAQVKGKGNTKNGSWVIDHCHDTGYFRGWLCHKCNRALGGFDDCIETLCRAISYLEVNKQCK